MDYYNGSISFKRIIWILFTCVVFLAGCAFLSFRSQLSLDESIVILVLDIIYLSVFISVLTIKRIRGLYDPAASYMGLFFSFLFVFLALILGTFVPFAYFPVVIISLILTAALDEGLAISSSVFIIAIYAYCQGFSFYSTISYMLLAIIGVFLGKISGQKGIIYKIIAFLMTLFITFLIPVLFVYLNTFELPVGRYLYFGISALIGAFFAGFVYNFIRYLCTRTQTIRYEIILDESYSILQELKRLSLPEFEHAKKLSSLSSLCARTIEADALLCAGIGLYYHCVNIDRKKSIKSFARRLNNSCFPPELIKALFEDGTNDRLPSSKESAIVHMVDSVLIKFEAIFKMANKTSWNTNMVVYQTLNELSSQGVYDKCGLSMNEFLKIRDCLAGLDYTY